MAAPSFVNAGTFVFSNFGTLVVPLPADIQTDDVLLLFIETANEVISVSDANGGTWTEVSGSPQGVGPAGAVAATRLTVFWSRYNGTQGDPSIPHPGDHKCGQILAYRGCQDTDTPIEASSGGVDPVSTTTLTITNPNSTTGDERLVILAVADDRDHTSSNRYDAWTNANLTAILERIDNGTTAANGGGLGVAEGAMATSGAIGDSTVTQASQHLVNGFLSFALIPVADDGITGSSAVVEGADDATGAGSFIEPAISGSGASTETTDATSGSGTFTPSPISGSGAIVEGADDADGAGVHAPSTISGSGAVVETTDVPASAGQFDAPVEPKTDICVVFGPPALRNIVDAPRFVTRQPGGTALRQRTPGNTTTTDRSATLVLGHGQPDSHTLACEE